jgi:hypothetical protein
VPEAVTDVILAKGVRDLGIHTELFADAMQRLVGARVVTNRHTFTHVNCAMSSIFLTSDVVFFDLATLPPIWHRYLIGKKLLQVITPSFIKRWIP